MHQSNRSPLALLPVVVIGIVNIASISVIYATFHDARKSAGSALMHPVISSISGGNVAGGPASIPSHASTGPNGSDSSPKSGQPVSTGGSSSHTAVSSSSKNSGSGSKVSLPATSASLIKGPPCKTQIPPAGVCRAILSLNTQKDGNPYWSPSLLAAMKQGVASNSYVQLLGLDPVSIYNSIQVSINESTWSGNATHGTIDGTTSAEGQSQPTTFTVDWNGSKWIVNDATLG